MGEILTTQVSHLNSSIEIGVRSSLILVSLDKDLSLDELVMLDYALLYSSEFGGPTNLHPALPNHIAEIGHRREALPEALTLFSQRGLISVTLNDSGYYYTANDETIHFVSCLKSSYYKKAWAVLDWINDNCSEITNRQINTLK